MHNDFSYAAQTDKYRATEGMTPCTFFERSRRGATSLRGLSRPNGAKMKKNRDKNHAFEDYCRFSDPVSFGKR